MFRAAFPNASEADERKETQYVKEMFNLAGNNGSAREPHIVRLAGTWVPPDTAVQFGLAYHILEIINLIVEAEPDPNTSYRRSTKGGTTPKATASQYSLRSSTASVAPPASSPSMPASKRRRESSPAPSPPQSVPPPQPNLPPPRRSARTKSPAPPPPSALKSPRSVRIARTVRVAEVTTPVGSDETVVEDDAETIEIAKPSLSQDMADQKELIERLKAERHAKTMDVDEVANVPLKRAREEEEGSKEELRFNFKEPETEERKISTNRRVSRFHLEPRQKSFAWGVAAFAIGIGAVYVFLLYPLPDH